MKCILYLNNFQMLSDNFSLRYYFLHLTLYFLTHHLLGSVQSSRININHKIDYWNIWEIFYLGWTVSTGCLPTVALEFLLLTDFLVLWDSWADSPMATASLSLLSALILLTVNSTLGCSSPQANQILEIRELGERTLETCLTRKIEWT